jgi:leucine-zipper of insertion element IS481
MKSHANPALSFRQRERMVRRWWSGGGRSRRPPRRPEVSDRACSKWVARYRTEGAAGLLDHSSAPAVVANRTEEHTIQAIAALRWLRFTGPEIAELLDRYQWSRGS